MQELRKIVANPILVESRRLGPFVPRVQHDTVVMDLMIHDVDIVLGLVDSEVRRITAAGARVHSARSDVANVQILFESGTVANITASRATEHKVRTLAITQPDAYISLDYTDQDIQIHRRAASEYVLNRESIRYRQESFVEHLFVHKENPLKLEILHILKAVREAQRTGVGRAPRAGRRPLARGGARDRAHDRGGTAAPRLAAPLSGMAEALGLVGGAGTLPALMAREARRAGWRVVAFALAAAEPLVPHADRVVPVRLGDVGTHPVGARRGEGSATWCSPGGSGRTCCSRARRWMRPPERLLARAADWSDEGLLETAVQGLAAMGIEVLDQRQFLAPWLVPAGLVAGPPVPPALESDVARGLELAREMAERGVGQTVVLRAGSVAAVEAMEGTDEAVRRGLALTGRGAVVAKSPATRARLPSRRAHRRAGYGGPLRCRWRGRAGARRRGACCCSTASAWRRKRPGRG